MHQPEYRQRYFILSIPLTDSSDKQQLTYLSETWWYEITGLVWSGLIDAQFKSAQIKKMWAWIKWMKWGWEFKADKLKWF